MKRVNLEQRVRLPFSQVPLENPVLLSLDTLRRRDDCPALANLAYLSG